jgi:hypothetical protein
MFKNSLQSEYNEIHKNKKYESTDIWEYGVYVLQLLAVYDEKKKIMPDESEDEYYSRIGGKFVTSFKLELTTKFGISFGTFENNTKKECRDKDGKPINLIQKWIDDKLIIERKSKTDRGQPRKYYFRDQKSDRLLKKGLKELKEKKNVFEQQQKQNEQMNTMFVNN